MSDFCVILVFKTVIYKSKLLGFKAFTSLELEHSELNTDFIDGHYLESVHNINNINISYLWHLSMLLIITPDFRQGLQIFRRYATLWTNTIYNPNKLIFIN